MTSSSGRELVVLDGAEFDAVLAADLVAVVAVDEDVAPQHQRVAAAFGQQAAFQRGVFDVGQRVDEGTQIVVYRDVQCRSLHFLLRHHGAGVHATPFDG